MDTKLGKVLTYREKLPILKRYDSLIKNLINFYIHFQKIYGH